jgi:hypothetical protein
MSPRAYHCWTPDEEETLRQMTTYTAAECAAVLGMSIGAITNKRERLRCGPMMLARETIRPVAEYAPPGGPTLAEVFAPNVSQDETDDEFWQRFLTVSRRTISKAAAQKYATITIASDVPIALCISSDWHVGPASDIDALHGMADLVAQTPGMYALAVGDLFDNPIKHKGSNVAGVADELRALDLLVGRFRGKLLGTTSGNHDDFSKVFSGQDALKALAIRNRIHYAPDELLWTVQITSPHDPEVVTAEYLIATRHQWRRHSNLNPTHACKTWLQEQQLNWETIPDVLAIGHNHVAAIGSEQYAGRDVHYLRMGSFQRDSAYARAKGFADYRPTAPTVVLPPTRAQRIACFPDPQDAVQHMRGWRDVAA